MSELPRSYQNFRSEFPEIAEAYDALGQQIHEHGPLDDKTRQLVKLAFAIGARLEGAAHAHIRRSLEMGISVEEIKHVALLAMTTLGFPTTVSAYTWIEDIVKDQSS
ncbi:MAG: carboxymuconolactone decarboxylase family protein [Phototrophicales bacterium]|nr:MAG: carboxymuconolactone decarboxylase family protein [Phototrophicales bacterium]